MRHVSLPTAASAVLPRPTLILPPRRLLCVQTAWRLPRPRAAARLAQPMREGQLRVIPYGVEDLESMGTVVRIYKDVKILGVANNAGIVC